MNVDQKKSLKPENFDQVSLTERKKRDSTLDLNDFINTILADSNITFLVSADPMPLSMISAVQPIPDKKSAMITSVGKKNLENCQLFIFLKFRFNFR